MPYYAESISYEAPHYVIFSHSPVTFSFFSLNILDSTSFLNNSHLCSSLRVTDKFHTHSI
jgi:hypothetical protein